MTSTTYFKIEEFLEKNTNYNYFFIRSEMSNILNTDITISEYRIICDQTNNTHQSDDNLNAEVFVRSYSNVNIQHFSFLIKEIKKKKIRSERKQKLKKLNAIN